MTGGLIGAKWTRYCASSIAPDADARRISESRRAFYAGAVALLDLMVTNFSDGDTETPSDIRLVEKLDRELRDFVASVRRGEA